MPELFNTHIAKTELRHQKVMSALLSVILLLPFALFLWQEYQMYIISGQDSTMSFFEYRYQTKFALIIDIVMTLLILVGIARNVQAYRYIKTNYIFSGLSHSAEIPIFIVDKNHELYWTNLNEVSYLSHASLQNAMTLFLADEFAVKKLDECFATGETKRFEKSFKVDDKKYWFNITLAKLKSKNLVSGFLSDITELKQATDKIDNQQREMQMQNEMLSIITAQLEVQQAAMKEQNDVLTQQHKKLELQANLLKSNNEELEFRNKQITKKNSYITDSIKYAQTIQEALLPSEQQMNGFFENFVIYRPKDIVSGDFYWFAVNENYIFTVMGDCTGHGVPGAFMSMIGVRLLGELITENKIDRPSVILEAMHDRIVAALKQDTTENTDGMDIAICRFKRVFDKDHDYEMKYAGAKQPVYVLRKGSQEVESFPSDRRGIGGQTYSDVFFFEDHDYNLNIGDRVYLSTDGIKDQNNLLRKRFGTNRLKMVINYTSTEKIADQKRFIEEILNHWQGLEEQRDDISLWGFELGDKMLLPDNTL